MKTLLLCRGSNKRHLTQTHCTQLCSSFPTRHEGCFTFVWMAFKVQLAFWTWQKQSQSKLLDLSWHLDMHSILLVTQIRDLSWLVYSKNMGDCWMNNRLYITNTHWVSFHFRAEHLPTQYITFWIIVLAHITVFVQLIHSLGCHAPAKA